MTILAAIRVQLKWSQGTLDARASTVPHLFSCVELDPYLRSTRLWQSWRGNLKFYRLSRLRDAGRLRKQKHFLLGSSNHS